MSANGLEPVGQGRLPVEHVPGSQAWFERYLALFHAGDFDGFSAYYADDVQFFGRAATLTGRQAVVEFYRGVRQRLDERIELVGFVGSECRCAAEIVTHLTPYADWDDFPSGPLKGGVTRRSINFVFYDIADGRFTRIRSANFARLPDA